MRRTKAPPGFNHTRFDSNWWADAAFQFDRRENDDGTTVKITAAIMAPWLVDFERSGEPRGAAHCARGGRASPKNLASFNSRGKPEPTHVGCYDSTV